MRYLHWEDLCLESLPSNFCVEQLVEFHMPHNKLTKLWDGIQNLVNLKSFVFRGSIPGLSKAEKLEFVWFDDCESLRCMSMVVHICQGILSGIKGNDNLELIYHLHSAIPSSIWPNRKLSFLSLSSYNKVDKLSNDLGMGSITAPDHYGSMQRNAPELSSLQALTYSQHWTLFIIRTFGAI
ncbi:hypothetical protein JHK87_055420 [Glycine soja]|nr:hypothetical protein JHK87_055420 [Glycine soja]